MVEEEKEFAEVRPVYFYFYFKESCLSKLKLSTFVRTVVRQRACDLGTIAAYEYPALDWHNGDRRHAGACVGMDGEWHDERVSQET